MVRPSGIVADRPGITPEEVADDDTLRRLRRGAADPQARDTGATSADEQRLARARLQAGARRAWSGFTNFAISFTIISVLAGTFTTFAFAWQNGGPIAVSIGWPVLCFFVLMVAFSMAELTSRYPTAGGPYWWAHDLGGKGWSWMTGWFNIVGLVGIVASVGYGCAIFLNATFAPLRPRHLRRQLRRRRAHPRRDLAALLPDHGRSTRW